MLGPGIYVTVTLEKAINYAKKTEHGGVVLVLEASLGRCKTMRKLDPGMKVHIRIPAVNSLRESLLFILTGMKTWRDEGFDRYTIT